MKIVAWDIGIKNLAYCIVEKCSNDKYPYIVHKWDIINITEDKETSCSYKDCESKEIKFCCKSFDEHLFFCKNHKTYHKIINDKWDATKDSLHELKEKQLCNMCKKNAKWKLGEKCLCTVHKTQLIKKYDKEISLKKYSSSKVKSFTIEELKLNLFNKLDAIPELLDVEEVCIENQPTFKNPRMKAISDSLFSWYIIRGKIDKKTNPIKNVFFMSPSNKLKIEDQKDSINDEINESSNKYKTTKNLSIEHCKKILDYEPKYIDHLEKYKKCDDLADAFLMCVYYFKKCSL